MTTTLWGPTVPSHLVIPPLEPQFKRAALGVAAIVTLLLVTIVIVGALFWTWIIMLVAGAIGLAHLGFVQLLPVGLLVALVLGALSKS